MKHRFPLVERDDRVLGRVAARREVRAEAPPGAGRVADAHHMIRRDAHPRGDHLGELLRRRRDDPHVEASRLQGRHELVHRGIDAQPPHHVLVASHGLGRAHVGLLAGVERLPRQLARLVRRMACHQAREPGVGLVGRQRDRAGPRGGSGGRLAGVVDGVDRVGARRHGARTQRAPGCAGGVARFGQGGAGLGGERAARGAPVAPRRLQDRVVAEDPGHRRVPDVPAHHGVVPVERRYGLARRVVTRAALAPRGDHRVDARDVRPRQPHPLPGGVRQGPGRRRVDRGRWGRGGTASRDERRGGECEHCAHDGARPT